MKFTANQPPRPAFLLLLGLSGGLLGEALLFMHAQTAKVESLLLEDFRVLAFLNRKSQESRSKVVEERLRALPGVEDVRFLSPEQSLAEISARDPELVKSIALLGDNPLTGALEIKISAEELPNLPDWIKAAEDIGELTDIRYKPLQARAILQARFYHRFLTLVLSMAGFLWFMGAAAILGLKSSGKVSLWGRVSALHAAISGLGTALGMGACVLFAYPVSSAQLLRAWPRPEIQGSLLLAGALGGWMISLRSHPPGKHPGGRASWKSASQKIPFEEESLDSFEQTETVEFLP